MYFLVFEAFQIDPNDYVSFDFLNNHHAPDVDILPRLIAQHKNSGSFYIEVLLEQPTLSMKAEVIIYSSSFCIVHTNITSLTILEYSQLLNGYRQKISSRRI